MNTPLAQHLYRTIVFQLHTTSDSILTKQLLFRHAHYRKPFMIVSHDSYVRPITKTLLCYKNLYNELLLLASSIPFKKSAKSRYHGQQEYCYMHRCLY